MFVPTLDALYLTDDEREIARHEIEKMAYYKWQAAGCPAASDQNFWREAEIDWIEYCYVPDRQCVMHE